jgi:hypothetical protein
MKMKRFVPDIFVMAQGAADIPENRSSNRGRGAKR